MNRQPQNRQVQITHSQINKLSRTRLWTVWLVLVVLGPTHSQELAAPRLHLSQETWDFGALQRGQQTSHTLVISNVGQKTLHIAQVRSSCTTCSVIEGYKQFLEPGESSEVRITFHAEGRKGRVTKTIYIDSNDPENPQTMFRLTGIIKRSDAPEILVDPNPWYPDSVSTDPAADGLFIITNEGLSPLIIRAMEPMGCVVREQGFPPVAPGDSTQIHIGFDRPSLAWKGERHVLVRSNDPFQQEMKITIIAPSATDFADTVRTGALIFVTEDCSECAYVTSQIVAPLRRQYPGFEVREIALGRTSTKTSTYEMLRILEKEFKDTSNEIPVLFIGDQVLGGRKEIEKNLEREINNCLKKGGCEYPRIVEPERKGKKSVQKPIYIAYFYQAGCKQCDRVSHMLASLSEQYEKLHIEEFNIGSKDNKILNEALGALLNIPDEKRLVTPALVIGDQYLVLHEITDDRVLGIIEGFRDSGSMCAWQEAQENQADARLNIIDRFKAFGPLTVILGGLVDGINPCAFATIIFFMSYLAFIGRKGKDLLYVGMAFTVAVFLTYLSIGLGFFHFIQSLKIFNLVSMIIYVITAALALILGVYSIYDIIKIRRGRASDMTLQLPEFLKKRIHKTIREKSRMRRFVAAAFVTGWAVSLLELACTGQVYLPTICFVTGVPELRLHAYFYLVLYNLMFILPLCLVFGLSYYGTTSDQIASWMKRHIVLMKAALAVFFLCLGIFLLSVIF